MSVRIVLVRMGLRKLPSLALAGKFGSLGTIMNYVRIGFSHMLYKLWLVGRGSKGYLEVII